MKVPAFDDKRMIILLALVYLLIRLPLLNYLPFIRDEALYAVMITEQINHPTLIPTFFGYPVSWKPPLFFWTYSILTQISLPAEAAFRLPSLLFGLFTIPILFRIFRNVGISRNLTFFSLIIFMVSYVSSYSNAALLLDSELFFFISLSLLFYTEKTPGKWKFLFAGIFAALAFFTKLAVAFIIPVLAVAYYHERKSLKNPWFLLSLFSIPISALILSSIFSTLSNEMYIEYTLGLLFSFRGAVDQLQSLTGSLQLLLFGSGIWFALSLFGFWKHWKENLFMSVWYLLSFFPILAGNYMPWYYLPVFPAIAYFASLLLVMHNGKEAIDKFFAIIFSIFLVASLATIAFLYYNLNEEYTAQKNAGLLVSGNVLIIGDYAPTILPYLQEKDFGWILAHNQATPELISDFVDDYHSCKYDVTDGSFSPMFHRPDAIYRKDTGISSFDYLILSGNQTYDAELIYDRSGIRVYSLED
ncbi:glycosyltransferase family 39 protein [Candidatus Micrarchaeota archaeon]|nr:glycosyltransferase family 39 protein [Candidatus Micrarchaeota archaeon]